MELTEEDILEIKKRIAEFQEKNGQISRAQVNQIINAYVTEKSAPEDADVLSDAETTFLEGDTLSAYIDLKTAEHNELFGPLMGDQPAVSGYPTRVVGNTPSNMKAGARMLPYTPSHIEGGGRFVGPGFAPSEWADSIEGDEPSLSVKKGKPTWAAKNRLVGKTIYEGENLVDEFGKITDITNYEYEKGVSAIETYASMASNPAQQKAFLYLLEDHGFYGEGEPSSMALAGHTLDSNDVYAINDFLLSSAQRGLTWGAYARIVASQPEIIKDKPKSGGVQFSSAKDISYDAHRYAMATLGRPLTKEELKAAVASVQQQQAAATGSEAPASREVLTIEAVKDRAPQEAAVYGLGQALDVIFRQAGKG